MEHRISVQIDWDEDEEDESEVEERLDKLFTKLMKAFPKYASSQDGFSMVTFRATDDRLAAELVRWMKPQKEKWQVVVVDLWGVEELVRARWAPLTLTADDADDDKNGDPLNQFPSILCRTCGWWDEAIVPAPYKVRDTIARKKEEVFPVKCGLLVVKERVRDLLLDLVRDQVEWGETVLVNASGKTAGAGKDAGVFWVRPKFRIGRDVAETPEDPCPNCGVPRSCGNRPDLEAPLLVKRQVVEHFGDRKLNIACLDTWLGTREDPAAAYVTRPVVVSGGLWAHLHNCNVKGLVMPEQGLYSKKEAESPIEAERRFAGLMSGKEDKILRARMPWQED